jgi:hypothetical protein
MFLVRPRGQSAAGGLRASMRFMGPEKGGVVVVSRTPGLLGCWGFQAAGASPPDADSPSEGRGERAEGGGRGGYGGT